MSSKSRHPMGTRGKDAKRSSGDVSMSKEQLSELMDVDPAPNPVARPKPQQRSRGIAESGEWS